MAEGSSVQTFDRDYELALQRAKKRVKDLRSFYSGLSVYACVIPFLWGINLLSYQPHNTGYWAVWPTIGWGLGMMLWGAQLWASANGGWFGSAWEERKVEEYLARANLKRVSSEKQLAQAQLRLLQAQIEPHFLFNTLANIQSLIKRDPDAAQNMLDRFITYLRQSLAASRKPQATVAQEVDLIENYLEIIRLRMGQRLNYTLNISPEVLKQPLAPMLIQPLVENAIRHGLEPKADGGHLSVHAKATPGGGFEIEVLDDGLGVVDGSPQANTAGGGVGLSNLRERLKVLYDGAATLELVDAQPGTLARIRLPFVPTR